MKKITIITLILLMSFMICGCDDKDKPVSFGKMKEESKEEFIIKYFEDEYKIKTTLSSEIKKINDEYYGYVKMQNGDLIEFWINEDKKVVDTFYVYEVNSSITEYFMNILAEGLDDFQITTITKYNSKPTTKFKPKDYLSMLSLEDVNTTINFFVSKNDKGIMEEKINNNLGDRLNFTSGILNIYYVDEIENLNINDVDLSKPDYQYVISKK